MYVACTERKCKSFLGTFFNIYLSAMEEELRKLYSKTKGLFFSCQKALSVFQKKKPLLDNNTI
jgi:hypothetical protein